MNTDDNVKDVPAGLVGITDYYPYVYYCKNCGRTNKKMIKKGVSIKDTTTICYYCGCAIKGRA